MMPSVIEQNTTPEGEYAQSYFGERFQQHFFSVVDRGAGNRILYIMSRVFESNDCTEEEVDILYDFLGTKKLEGVLENIIEDKKTLTDKNQSTTGVLNVISILNNFVLRKRFNRVIENNKFREVYEPDQGSNFFTERKKASADHVIFLEEFQTYICTEFVKDGEIIRDINPETFDGVGYFYKQESELLVYDFNRNKMFLCPGSLDSVQGTLRDIILFMIEAGSSQNEIYINAYRVDRILQSGKEEELRQHRFSLKIKDKSMYQEVKNFSTEFDSYIALTTYKGKYHNSETGEQEMYGNSTLLASLNEQRIIERFPDEEIIDIREVARDNYSQTVVFLRKLEDQKTIELSKYREFTDEEGAGRIISAYSLDEGDNLLTYKHYDINSIYDVGSDLIIILYSPYLEDKRNPFILTSFTSGHISPMAKGYELYRTAGGGVSISYINKRGEQRIFDSTDFISENRR